MYIMTITYNFDGASIVKKCETRKEAIRILREYLEKEIETIKKECKYVPSVLVWSDDDIVLVYAEGYAKDDTDRNYATEDCAYYRIFAVN